MDHSHKDIRLFTGSANQALASAICANLGLEMGNAELKRFSDGEIYFQIMENAYGILGIEYMAAAQALDFREFKFGAGVTKAKEVIRKYVDFLDIDRPLYPDHNKMLELVRSNEILDEVEKLVGSLEG